MKEHFRLEEAGTEEAVSFVFNNVTRKVIMDAFKHARLQSITYYYL
jgi:hypothetical protein